MTEYEIAELLNGVNSNIMAGQAIFLSILSAYLVVAYTAGKSLTTYQVSFINFTFILMMFVGFNAQAAQVGHAYSLADQLAPFRTDMQPVDTTGEIVRVVFIGIRFVLSVGALIFMWQVRHPKAE